MLGYSGKVPERKDCGDGKSCDGVRKERTVTVETDDEVVY
jgi:hypothetical protein